MDYQLHLPAELEPYRQQFLASIRPFIKITPGPASPTKPWQSKIGGQPYMPLTTHFPKNKNGKNLFFLAQINFSEVPPLEGFPQKGLLQFYISDERNYGLDYEIPDEQNNFRILFFENIEKDEELIRPLPKHPDHGSLPIDPYISYPLKFSLQQEAVPLSDHNIHDYISNDFFNRFGPKQWEIMNAYSKIINAKGHKIGGYAFFTQEDVRYEMGEYELLFQLDSDPEIHCLWGDMGVANFFVKKEDLLKKDFSKVLYNWDCY